MKRYDLDGYEGFMKESENGDYVLFTDHQAEMARLHGLLNFCIITLEKQSHTLATEIKKLIAQKDNTQ